MRIDAHQHFWEYNPIKHSWISDEMSSIRKDFSPADLSPILISQHLDGCIAVQADETDQETKYLLDLSDEYEFIKGVVGWSDLKKTSTLENLKSDQRHPKLVGFRCIMQGQPDEMYLKNKVFQENLAVLSTMDYTYDLLIYHYQLPSLIQFVDQLPDNRLILDHLGKPDIKGHEIKEWKENIRILAAHPKIYCKLSGMITEADYMRWTSDDIVPYLDVVGEYFGTDRLCFGSDWPVCLVAGSYEKMMHVVEKWSDQFSSEVKNNIFGNNTERFYKI